MLKILAKIICLVLAVALLISAIGVLYKYTNGFNEDFKTFYIEYDEKQILTSDSKLTLERGKKHRFDVKYTFDTEDSEAKEYKVKIIPNVTRDFDYTVDGERYLFSKLGDLTDVFDITKSDTFFELYLPDDLTFSEVLRQANDGKSISVPQEALTNNPYPFRLQISSYNEKVTYNIDFTFGESNSTDTDQSGDESTDTPTTPSTPKETTYDVSYFFDGSISNLSDISMTGDSEAKEGDTVTFKIIIGDSRYSISGMRADVMNSNAIVEIKQTGNTYSFIMPKGNVIVRVYIEYNDPQGKITYPIVYESLGWAGMGVVNLSCPDRAAAGETVTFTATIKPEYADQYYISGIKVSLVGGDDYGGYLEEKNGTYSFVMPDTATMEGQAEGCIELLFYIMPIDM